jgi:aspartate dehydrogenase
MSAPKESMMPPKIGIVGYGTIGTYLVKRISADQTLKLDFIYDIDKERLSALDKSLILNSIEELKGREVNLVVEVADAGWVSKSAPLVLEQTDLLIFSVTAFAEEGLIEKLDRVAKDHGTSYYVSHGAILGLDGVRDGKEVLQQVMITTIKAPSKLGLKEKVSTRTVLYEGPTRKACELYPRNVNVHASLALHGLGFDKTISKIIADPEVLTMRHIIEVKGPGMSWTIDIQSSPVGAVTGAFTPESAFNTIRRICIHENGLKFI